jgi:tetratricopeptide (TPR) repeat protein
MDDDTTLVVLSDHGFELGTVHGDPSKTRDLRRVTEKFHRIEGILYLYGNGVRAHTRIDQPTQLDITPTLLALAGFAPALDMPGRVLREALDFEASPPTVSTYESADPGRTAVASDSRVDPQIMARLRSLGYVGGASSPEGDRNLAAIYFEAGRYAEAVEVYEQLIRDDPDDASLRTSLAGALGALERYEDALAELAIAIDMEPLNVEAYHNRAAVFERQGRVEEAIADYQTAVRYDPQYEPSRQALLRLVGTADLRVPKNEAEQQALGLAEQAGEAARRGAYREAMDLLAEAERIAPRYVLVYQYQSNVAYLMGDTAAAITALEKALEIEPDNALFETNLRRLRGQAHGPQY